MRESNFCWSWWCNEYYACCGWDPWVQYSIINCPHAPVFDNEKIYIVIINTNRCTFFCEPLAFKKHIYICSIFSSSWTVICLFLKQRWILIVRLMEGLICTGQSFPLRIYQFNCGALQISAFEGNGGRKASGLPTFIWPKPEATTMAISQGSTRENYEHMGQGWCDQSQRQRIGISHRQRGQRRGSIVLVAS